MSVEDLTLPATTASRRRALAHALFGLTVLAIGAAIVFTVLAVRQGRSQEDVFGGITFLVGFVTFPFVGYVLASRRPDNLVGWVLFATGVGPGSTRS
jgi:hypothetical protein